MADTLERRIEALERAVTEGDHDLSALAAEGEQADRLDDLEARLDDLEDRVAELDAATQALRGYVGNVRSVNRDVEKRADAALAKAEALESTVDETPAPKETGPTAPDTSIGPHQTESRPATNGVTTSDSSDSRPSITLETNGATATADTTAQTDTPGQDGTPGGADAPGQADTEETYGQEAASGPEADGHTEHCHACGRPTTPETSAGTARTEQTDPATRGTAAANDTAAANGTAATSERTATDRQSTGGSTSERGPQQSGTPRSGTATQQSGTTAGGRTAGSGKRRAAPDAGTAGETEQNTSIASLDPEFRAETEDSDPSTFERIRKML
jgi:uncharacterized coiled-coil protein SlyX